MQQQKSEGVHARKGKDLYRQNQRCKGGKTGVVQMKEERGSDQGGAYNALPLEWTH